MTALELPLPGLGMAYVARGGNERNGAIWWDREKRGQVNITALAVEIQYTVYDHESY